MSQGYIICGDDFKDEFWVGFTIDLLVMLIDIYYVD